VVSAAERVRRVIEMAGSECGLDEVEDADPHLAQDAEDGRALRELYAVTVVNNVDAWRTKRADDRDTCHVSASDIKGHQIAQADGPTIAAAADACREALRDA
jgi:hypothetical protein